MNAPLVKNPQSGFQLSVLIRKVFHVAPSFLEVACHVSIHLFSGSSRVSSQMTWNVPFGAAATHAKNWSFGAGWPELSTESVFASDHVWSPSRDSQYEMFVPDWARSMEFCST